jgi:hypothetical protein
MRAYKTSVTVSGLVVIVTFRFLSFAMVYSFLGGLDSSFDNCLLRQSFLKCRFLFSILYSPVLLSAYLRTESCLGLC